MPPAGPANCVTVNVFVVTVLIVYNPELGRVAELLMKSRCTLAPAAKPWPLTVRIIEVAPAVCVGKVPYLVVGPPIATRSSSLDRNPMVPESGGGRGDPVRYWT